MLNAFFVIVVMLVLSDVLFRFRALGVVESLSMQQSLWTRTYGPMWVQKPGCMYFVACSESISSSEVRSLLGSQQPREEVESLSTRLRVF